MIALALISDLMTASQVEAAGKRTGANVRITATVEAMIAAAAEGTLDMIVIDLSHPGLTVDELVPRLVQLVPKASLVAFGPHVHHERLELAQAAGCHRVLSRGQFLARVDELLNAS